MNRYPSYKPTSVKWLGEIPSHWEAITLKRVFIRRIAGSWGEDENKLPKNSVCLRIADYDYGKLSFKTKEEYTVRSYFEDEVENKHLVKGDILIEKSGGGEKTPVGRCVMYDLDIEKPMYANFMEKLVCHSMASPKFINYLMSSLYTCGVIWPYVKATTGIQNLDITSLLQRETVYLPPFEEQSAIASYLDTATAKIDTAIAQQQKMIDLLNERKQIIINRAVTKGLNSDVKMKDSGVEWIGEVPEGWSFVRLKHLSTIISKGTTPSTIGREILSNGNIRFIKAENIVKNEVSAFPEFYIDKTTHQILKRSNLKAGDLLFVIAGATIGKVAILPDEMTPANTNQAISFIRLTNRNNVKYVWLVLQSDITKKYIWENAVQSAQPNISMEDLGNIQIPLPTNEDEQRKILSYVESQIEPIDKSINSCIKQISLLQERKQIIINEVVTGKVRVV